MKHSRLAVACLSFVLITPATFAQTRSIEEQVSEVVSYLVGTMDSSAQAIAHRDAPDVRITTCPIAVPTISAAFLYQEQALSMNLDDPYRQRFLQIAPNNSEDAVESKAFKLANPEAWIGLCDRPASDRVVTIDELGETVCSLFLQPERNGYRGTTPEEGCPTNFRGAVRITNTVFLDATTMETWDRGFDATGNQVWGADDRSYRYSDIDPDTHDPEVNAIAQMLNGKFDNAAQVAEDESFLPVRQNNCPVTIENSPFPENTPVLVSEQAANAPTLQFASQRILQIRRSDLQLEMASYKLNGDGYADFCDRPETERVLSAGQIGDPECSIFFEREGDEFVGSTPPGGCPSNFRGSQYLTIDARFSSERLEIWERWYDAEGNQVAGSETETYVYLAEEM
ncbi:MAG: CpcT/CpeT family chromophore lyase [Cyanobacteriota bacterium]|nr:CpcT/CpeT family chromophore lyase [Cyanobacteriota bacterium]